MEKTGVVGGVLVFIAGLAIFLEGLRSLYEYVPSNEFFSWILTHIRVTHHWSDSYIIGVSEIHPLYLGIILMLVGLYIARMYDEWSTSRS